jgi:hypothetical protein
MPISIHSNLQVTRLTCAPQLRPLLGKEGK